MLFQNKNITSVLVKSTLIRVDWLLLYNQIDQVSTSALFEHIKRLVSSGHLMTNLADEKGFNLLHHAVLKGVPGKVAFLIDLCKKLQNPSSQQFSAWIDAKTDKECFTALHFACYRNNLEAINTLLRNGADKNALTATDLSMMHVAAQSDAAASLYICKELGIDLNGVDKKGSTPLHWACFL